MVLYYVIYYYHYTFHVAGYNKNEKEANVKKTSTASTNQLTSTEHVNGIEDDSLDESEDSKESPDSGDELRSIKGQLLVVTARLAIIHQKS